MKKLKVFFIIFIFISIFLIFLFFTLGNSFFKVKSVEIYKDFVIDNNKIIRYLNIYPAKPIWKYNIRKMNEKLSILYYLKEFEIKKKYPNTLIIKLIVRQPIARIVGKEGKIFLLDINRVIFQEVNNKNNDLPLILINSSDFFKNGIIIDIKYSDLLNVLYKLKKDNIKIYNSISQISCEVTNSNLNYSLMFRTFNQRIHLKNSINVDSIKKGLSCILYLSEKGYFDVDLIYNKNGFVLL